MYFVFIQSIGVITSKLL